VYEGVLYVGVVYENVLYEAWPVKDPIYIVYLYCKWLRRYRDSLRAQRSGDQIQVGARFSPPFQTGPEAHSTSYTMGTASYPGVKRPRRGVDHPTTSSAEVKKE
jgi:hypothetical protein